MTATARLLLLLSAISVVAASVICAGPAEAAETGIGDIVLDSKVESMNKAGLGAVTFPHTLHEKSNKCDECHPSLFEKKHGANNISMQKNMDGEYCGACHDSIKSFPLFHCAKCHTKLKSKK